MLWLTIVLTIAFVSVFSVFLALILKKNQDFVKKMNTYSKKSKKKRIAIVLLIIFGFGGIIFCFYNVTNRISFIRTVSGSFEWKYTNGQYYLDVQADSPYDLGYRTGQGLGTQIAEMKTSIDLFIPLLGMSRSRVKDLSQEYLPYIPEKYQQEIEGMADGATQASGIHVNFEDILYQSLFLEILYGQFKNPSNALGGCTALASVNDNGKTTIGQNIDLSKVFGVCGAFVLSELGKEGKIFSYRIGGHLGLPMGKNSHGIFICSTIVQLNYEASFTAPIFVRAREAFSSTTIDNAYNTLFLDGKSPLGWTYFIGDENRIISIQTTYSARQKSESINEVHTNTYTIANWQDKLLKPDYSKERQEHAEKLLSTALVDGKMTEPELLDILSDQPTICRNNLNPIESSTVAFITYNYFGIQNANVAIGNLPL